MNVIFLDFDGVLDTAHLYSDKDLEEKIQILSLIVKECDAKIVIEASAKDGIDEKTLETDFKWINKIFSLFKKYNIECIGRTPNVRKYYSKNNYAEMWKEYEIIKYLRMHPEIKHFCVIDDDDLGPKNSDLNLLRDHLVQTIYYSENHSEEGLLLKHKEEAKLIMKKENKWNK